MIVRIALAIGIFLVVVLCLPSLIATCTLLIKSIGDLGQKRQRRTAPYRR
ncbi:MAG: hypothetical protein ABSA57_16090 [Candidatus Acidiferrales bacterium]|jgi:hypothetical protein